MHFGGNNIQKPRIHNFQEILDMKILKSYSNVVQRLHTLLDEVIALKK